MANTPGAPIFGFSLQPDGDGKPDRFVGIHIDAPMVSVVFAIPILAADAFVDDFAKNVRDLANQAKSTHGLVIATSTTMDVLKKGPQ